MNDKTATHETFKKKKGVTKKPSSEGQSSANLSKGLNGEKKFAHKTHKGSQRARADRPQKKGSSGAMQPEKGAAFRAIKYLKK